MTDEVGRNDPCPCGSGRKYKTCHGAVAIKPSRPNSVGTVPTKKPRPDRIGSIAFEPATYMRQSTFLSDLDQLRQGGSQRSELVVVPTTPESVASAVSSFIDGARLLGSSVNPVENVKLHSQEGFAVTSSSMNREITIPGIAPKVDVSSLFSLPRPRYEGLSPSYVLQEPKHVESINDFFTPGSILGSTAFDRVGTSLDSLGVGSLKTWAIRPDDRAARSEPSVVQSDVLHLNRVGFEAGSALTVHRFAESPGLRSDLVGPIAFRTDLDPAFASLLRASGPVDLSGLVSAGGYAGDLLSTRSLEDYATIAIPSFLETAKQDLLQAITTEAWPSRKSLALIMGKEDFEDAVTRVVLPLLVEFQDEILAETEHLLTELRRRLERDSEMRSALANSAAIFGPPGAAVVATASWLNVLMGKRQR